MAWKKKNLKRKQILAIDLFLLGYSDVEIIDKVKVSRTTFYLWKNDILFKKELESRINDIDEENKRARNAIYSMAVKIIRNRLISKKDFKVALKIFTNMSLSPLQKKESVIDRLVEANPDFLRITGSD